MSVFNKKVVTLAVSIALLSACSAEKQKTETRNVSTVDILITNGMVYTGENNQGIVPDSIPIIEKFRYNPGRHLELE